ncbi:MAG: hypothetical protein ACXW1W_20400, partial [Methylococcaceae bacterium]
PFDRFQSNLGFLRAGKNLTLFFTHNLLLLSQATILNYCPDIGVHFTDSFNAILNQIFANYESSHN